MFTKVLTAALLLIFFAVMTGIGLYCRRHATNVNGFVLGGRSVGPWLSAFAFGTSYFSAVVFVGYAGQFGMGDSGTENPDYDPASFHQNHAGLFREAV